MARAPQITGQAIVDEARTWLGVPFHHQGRSRHGVDCIGLVVCARNALAPWADGMKSERNYPRNPTGRLVAGLEQYLTRIENPEPGCVALIAWPKQELPAHVAILTPDTMIHAYAATERVVEAGYRGHWVRWTKSLWRLPGVGA